MNDNTKIEVAREIMNSLIAKACSSGFTTKDKYLISLLKDEKQMENFNFKVIDKILNNYSLLVKRRI